MKFFISSDMEGVCGCTDWLDVREGNPRFPAIQRQMTREVQTVVAALKERFPNCSILIKDAHLTGSNLLFQDLGKNYRILYGWDESPDGMVEGLDSSFDACIFLGYHSGAGVDSFPMAHTYDSKKYAKVFLNGRACDEFDLFSLRAWDLGVPVTLVSGDRALCQRIRKSKPEIETVWTLEGRGGSILSKSPQDVEEELKLAVKNMKIQPESIKLPHKYILRIEYFYLSDAKRASYYPGARQIDEKTLEFEGKNIRDILILFLFI